ncbi:MAG: type II toxin-antitoxin system RelE/ParE family toxin [Pseudomonadota bacterium]
MSQVIVTEEAIRGLERCRQFLTQKNPKAAQNAARIITQHFILLETTPTIGRIVSEIPDLYELIIKFGNSGFVALYRYEQDRNAVYILAFRHQKEAGY